MQWLIPTGIFHIIECFKSRRKELTENVMLSGTQEKNISRRLLHLYGVSWVRFPAGTRPSCVECSVCLVVSLNMSAL